MMPIRQVFYKQKNVQSVVQATILQNQSVLIVGLFLNHLLFIQ